jgi:hypothetical protein
MLPAGSHGFGVAGLVPDFAVEGWRGVNRERPFQATGMAFLFGSMALNIKKTLAARDENSE